MTTVTSPEDGGVVVVSDGVDDTAPGNGHVTVVTPSTSTDAAVTAGKSDKDEKTKEEKPKTIGFFELVKFFPVFFAAFLQKCMKDVN